MGSSAARLAAPTEAEQGADARRSPDDASPPLTANRTMGALGSIAASRIARTFHFGGPSHTVCSEEGSAARAIELGVRALRAKDLDRALVGGVDLAGDPRVVLPGEVRTPADGAVAFVLKRLAGLGIQSARLSNGVRQPLRKPPVLPPVGDHPRMQAQQANLRPFPRRGSECLRVHRR